MLVLGRPVPPEMKVAITPGIQSQESDTEAETAMNVGAARRGRRRHDVEDRHTVIATAKDIVRLPTAVATGATVAVAVVARAAIVRHTTVTRAKKSCWMDCP